MRALILAALFLVALALFLAALMPASFVAQRLQDSTRGAVQLSEVTGTAWNGGGRAVVATPAGPLALDELRWRVVPAELAGGRVAYVVDARAAGFVATGEVAATMSGWEVRNFSASGGAAGAAAFLPILAHWRPEGTLAIEARELAWNESGIKGDASLEWRDAAMAQSEVRPFGSYRLDLRGDGGPANLTLSTLRGPIAASGKGTLAPDGRFAFTGEARADGADAQRLQPFLDMLGPRRPDGARSLEWRTR